MRVAEAIRHVALIGIAAVVTGVLIGGIGGRVFMRLSAVIAPDRATGAITENGAVVGDITFGGTVALIIFIGVFSGVFGGVVYTISEPWLSWAGPLRGVVFGVFLLATASLAVFDPNNLDFVILGNDPRNVIMLGVLFLAFGPVLVSLIPALDKRPLASTSRSRSTRFPAISPWWSAVSWRWLSCWPTCSSKGCASATHPG